MPTQHKTQCPRCQTIYPMPADKLNQPKARANCGKCHHTFFLNSHIIKDEAPKPAPAPAPIVTPAPKTADSGISAKSTQTIAKLVKEQPELATKHALPTTNTKPSETADLFAELDGLIHDKMNADKELEAEAIDFDGLGDFLNNDVVIPDIVAATQVKPPKGAEEEAWAEALIKKEEETPKQQMVRAISRPQDDMSDVFGSEFDNIPVASANATLDKKELQKKVEQRIAAQPLSQEQLSKRRGAAGQLMWIIGCIGLLVLMGVQYVIFNTDNIAKRPTQAAMIESLCMGCTLPKADPNAFVNTYELQIGSNEHTTNLIGTLQNNAGNDQLYPNLKVSIYGNNMFLGDFVASPKDYLVTQQRLLASGQGKRYMFTLPNIAPQDISKVTIEPFY